MLPLSNTDFICREHCGVMMGTSARCITHEKSVTLAWTVSSTWWSNASFSPTFILNRAVATLSPIDSECVSQSRRPSGQVRCIFVQQFTKKSAPPWIAAVLAVGIGSAAIVRR